MPLELISSHLLFCNASLPISGTLTFLMVLFQALFISSSNSNEGAALITMQQTSVHLYKRQQAQNKRGTSLENIEEMVPVFWKTVSECRLPLKGLKSIPGLLREADEVKAPEIHLALQNKGLKIKPC